MLTPAPALLALVTLFWGWQTGLIFFAIPMAILLEAPRFTARRWEGTDKEFNRIADSGTVLFLGLTLYAYMGKHNTEPVLLLLRFLPMVFFPLTVALLFSLRESLSASVLFISLRKKTSTPLPNLPIAQLYACVCLLAAGVVDLRNPWYFPMVMVLAGWMLWAVRARRYPAATWLAIMVVVTGLGYGVQTSLYSLQNYLEVTAPAWIIQWLSGEHDPYRTSTAMGDVGRLKLSDRILFRVKQELPWQHPLLLREGVYNNYGNNEWFAFQSLFQSMPRALDNGVVLKGNSPKGDHAFTLFQDRSKPKSMLPVPTGFRSLDGEQLLEAQANPYAVVKVVGTPGYSAFRITYDPLHGEDAPPGREDLLTPSTETKALNQLVAEAGLATLSPGDVAPTLERFFQERFTYSLVQKEIEGDLSPLDNFLLRTRTGHCEFFATATVLLLRRMEIPARYVVGYSVQEFDENESLFVVRHRHAHAWVSYYLNGAWQELDTTPADWFQLEADQASVWQRVQDLWSRGWFQFSQWRIRHAGGLEMDLFPWGLALLLPMTGWIAWSIRRRVWVRRHPELGMKRSAEPTAPNRSPMWLVEEYLLSQGWKRGVGESLGAFLQRAGQDDLQTALRWHYERTFDADFFDTTDEYQLKRAIDDWLNRNLLKNTKE